MTPEANIMAVGDPCERRMRIRVRGALVAAVCLAALLSVAAIEPQAAGTGTHEQLGLSECGYYARTGWPCPHCGVTTSLSAMAHGRIVLAVRSHLLGVALFAVAAVAAAAGLAEMTSGRPLLWVLAPHRWKLWLAGAAGLTLGGWGLKIVILHSEGRLPWG